MARIRSIHPGMMTDEDYMALSFAARICLAGVWMEADDHGVFEWKPLTLKARIFPADNVDMAAVLAELQTHSWVKQFPHDGKTYGVCKNFRKWQRPKKPHYVHPFPDEYVTYTGLKAASSPPVPHQFPTASPIAPQMEEGGGRMDEKEGKKDPPRRAPKGAVVRSEEFQVAYQAYPLKVAPNRAAKAFANAIKAGATLQAILAGIESYKKNKPEQQAWAHFATWLNDGRWQDAHTPAIERGPTIDPDDSRWSLRIDGFDRRRFWNHDQWGPAPDQPGCKAPKRLLESRAA